MFLSLKTFEINPFFGVCVTIVLTDQVSLAFGLPPSTFNAASLAHYMSGTAGLQAFAAAGKATFSQVIGGSGINDVTH